jgi:antitoxin ParD1/3/4
VYAKIASKEFDMRSSKPITVTLGKQQHLLDARLQSGAYESASEVLRAALRALDREEDAINAIMRAKIREALDDPNPDIPAEDVFAELRAYHEEQVKADEREL